MEPPHVGCYQTFIATARPWGYAPEPMVASILDLLDFASWYSNPIIILIAVFQLWMFIDAVRQREWIWAVFIFFGWGIAAFLYYFYVFRAAPSATRGFELPGTQ